MNNIDLIFSAAVLAIGSAAATVKILIFFTLLLLFFWGLNIYKHIRSGWTNIQKMTDTIGGIMLVGFLISLIIPLMK